MMHVLKNDRPKYVCRVGKKIVTEKQRRILAGLDVSCRSMETTVQSLLDSTLDDTWLGGIANNTLNRLEIIKQRRSLTRHIGRMTGGDFNQFTMSVPPFQPRIEISASCSESSDDEDSLQETRKSSRDYEDLHITRKSSRNDEDLQTARESLRDDEDSSTYIEIDPSQTMVEPLLRSGYRPRHVSKLQIQQKLKEVHGDFDDDEAHKSRMEEQRNRFMERRLNETNPWEKSVASFRDVSKIVEFIMADPYEDDNVDVDVDTTGEEGIVIRQQRYQESSIFSPNVSSPLVTRNKKRPRNVEDSVVEDCVDISEMILKPRRLIHPITPDDSNVRRSARTRLPPLRQWLGEQAIYASSPGGSKSLKGVNRVQIKDPRYIRTRTTDPVKALERERRH